MRSGDYRDYRRQIIRLLAEVDPVGLVAFGAPDDEYELEVDDLLRGREPVSAEDVKAAFLRWFGEPTGHITDADADRLARGIARIREDPP